MPAETTDRRHRVDRALRHLGEAVEGRMPWMMEVLALLVEQRSVDGDDAAVERCLDIALGSVGRLASAVERPSFAGLGALVVRFGRDADDQRLLFAGHVDVVDAGDDWTSPPFRLTVREGRATGRGVSDMKGGVAAIITTLRVLDDLGILPDSCLGLLLTGDEEVGSERGMIPLMESRLVRGATAVCGEPTDLAVYVGNRGHVWLHVRICGKGGHAGLAHELANPLPVAAAVVTALAHLPLPRRDERFVAPSLEITGLQMPAAAAAVNVIPDEVTLGIDRRLLPGDDREAIVRQITDVVKNTVAPPFTAQIKADPVWPPYLAPAEAPIVAAAQAVVAAAGRGGLLGTDPAADDSSFLGQGGIPTILLGPGDPLEAHATDESVYTADLRTAVEIYARLALAFAGGEHDPAPVKRRLRPGKTPTT